MCRVEEARDLKEPNAWLGDLRPVVRISVGEQRKSTQTGGGINGHAPTFGEEFVFPLQRCVRACLVARPDVFKIV